MKDPTTARILIAHCFSVSEMACLQKQVEFQNAMTAINDFDDYEAAVALGLRLLDDHDPLQGSLWQRFDGRARPKGATVRCM